MRRSFIGSDPCPLAAQMVEIFDQGQEDQQQRPPASAQNPAARRCAREALSPPIISTEKNKAKPMTAKPLKRARNTSGTTSRP